MTPRSSTARSRGFPDRRPCASNAPQARQQLGRKPAATAVPRSSPDHQVAPDARDEATALREQKPRLFAVPPLLAVPPTSRAGRASLDAASTSSTRRDQPSSNDSGAARCPRPRSCGPLRRRPNNSFVSGQRRERDAATRVALRRSVPDRISHPPLVAQVIERLARALHRWQRASRPSTARQSS